MVEPIGLSEEDINRIRDVGYSIPKVDIDEALSGNKLQTYEVTVTLKAENAIDAINAVIHSDDDELRLVAEGIRVEKY